MRAGGGGAAYSFSSAAASRRRRGRSGTAEASEDDDIDDKESKSDAGLDEWILYSSSPAWPVACAKLLAANAAESRAKSASASEKREEGIVLV